MPASDGSGLELTVPPALLSELPTALRPVAGTTTLGPEPRLTVEIVTSFVRDRDGTIVQTIG